MAAERVLVCGAGVSGSIVAYFLGKQDYHVTVIERSKAEQTAGQGIEIEEPALEVVRQMGVLEELQGRKTGEEGFELVDQFSRSYGKFGTGRLSPTGALELMRGNLTDTLYRAADSFKHVDFRFETTIQSLSQSSSSAEVELKARGSSTITKETFELVIGADGQRSRTRDLLFGPPEQIDCFKPVYNSVAYFSIPSAPQDWPVSKLCNFTGGRVIWMRPRTKESNETSCYLICTNEDPDCELSKANAAQDRPRQKAALAEAFKDVGWESKRVLDGLSKASNFYSEDLMQVKLPKWSEGRVALVGDAAWAPTPMTGEGNQLAIIGAWVLAQELGRQRGPEAFTAYDRRLRKHVETMQQIPMGGYAPKLFKPQTAAGIWVLRMIVWTAAGIMNLLNTWGLLSMTPDKPVNWFDLQIEGYDEKKAGEFANATSTA